MNQPERRVGSPCSVSFKSTSRFPSSDSVDPCSDVSSVRGLFKRLTAPSERNGKSEVWPSGIGDVDSFFVLLASQLGTALSKALFTQRPFTDSEESRVLVLTRLSVDALTPA